MSTKTTNNDLFRENQKTIKQLQILEKVAWAIFVVIGLGYIVATIITN